MEAEKYKMIYEIEKNTDIKRILGEEFYKNNYNKGSIIYNNKKICPLQGLFPFKNIKYNKNDNLKIQMILSKDCYNKGYMFKNCSSLLLIKFYNNIYNNEGNDILLNNENNSFIDYNNRYIDNNIEIFNEKDNFFSISEIEEIDKDKGNLEEDFIWDTKISIMNELFYNCSSLISLPDISRINTKNVIDMSKIFYNCSKLSLLSDISYWNTYNVIDINKIFYNCSSLSSIPDISKWNTENLYNIDEMFYNCNSLISLPDISKWEYDFNNITIINNNCLSLQNIPILTKENNFEFKMNSRFEKYSLIIKSIYEIKGLKIIKIFDENFVYNNEGKCKMVINNKICELTDEYEILNDKMKFLKVRLIVLNNEKIDFSYMFYECHSLIDFEIISKEKRNLKNENLYQLPKRNNQIEHKNENYNHEISNKSENSYISNIENYNYQIPNNSKSDSFYSNLVESDISNISIDESEEQKTINSSSIFISPNNISIEFNNNNRFFSINKSSFPHSIIKIFTNSEKGKGKSRKNISLVKSNYKIQKSVEFKL